MLCLLGNDNVSTN